MPRHRSFTAKTAKDAKNIAKGSAILTHRTIAIERGQSLASKRPDFVMTSKLNQGL
jgi:hypothetical protein